MVGAALGVAAVTARQLWRNTAASPFEGAFLNLCGSCVGAAGGAVAWCTVHDRRLAVATVWGPVAAGIALNCAL